MSFTLGNIKAAAQARGYDAGTTAEQTTLVKSALRRLYGMKRWKFLEISSDLATTIGNGAVTFLSIGSLNHLDAVRLANGDALEWRPADDVRDLQLRDTTTGEPEFWSRFDGNIQLWPLPNAVYTLKIDYVYVPPLPAADGDTITWPDAYQDILVEDLCSALAYRQRDWPAFDRAVLERDKRVREMVGEYAIEQRQTPREVGRWDGWDDPGFS